MTTVVLQQSASYLVDVAQPGVTVEGTQARGHKPGYRLAAVGREAAEDERLDLLEQIYDPVSRRRRALVQPGWRCPQAAAVNCFTSADNGMALRITSRAATARVPRPLVDYVLADEPMEDRARKPDAIDQANALFWKQPTLDEVMADVAPITSWDDLDIPDLTDEERETFSTALDE